MSTQAKGCRVGTRILHSFALSVSVATLNFEAEALGICVSPRSSTKFGAS